MMKKLNQTNPYTQNSFKAELHSSEHLYIVNFE